MAAEDDEREDGAAESHEPRECMACRGTGRVISNLGGTPEQVSCPWCDGTGTRVPGMDAQARWLAERAEAEPPPPAAEPPPPAAEPPPAEPEPPPEAA